jgi:Abortive infection alpha
VPSSGRGEDPPALPGEWLLDLANAAIDLIPGAQLIRRTLASVERRALSELKDRLERLDARAFDVPTAAPPEAAPDEPSELLGALLARSLDQTPQQARRDAFATILRQLVPDEARIIAALSDGGGHAVIHVTAGSTLGSATRRVLSNVSPVGQAAGVQLRDMTPHYLAHLQELGLVELVAEDVEQRLKYEILESATAVRDAIAAIEGASKMNRARIVRRTVRLTPLGCDLWAACHGADRFGG